MIPFRSLFTKDYGKEEIMTDAKWLILLIAAASFEMGLLRSIQSLQGDGYFFIMGAVFLAVAAFPFFLPRLVLILAWTAGLGFDFALRKNPFSVLFLLVGVHHAYYLCRSLLTGKQDPQ